MNNLETNEYMKQPKNSLSFSICRPGGNNTCLIEKVIGDPKQRKEINDLAMRFYPDVEQVGFVNLDKDDYRLIMAGGEFCGNATRSTAWLALRGQPGEIAIAVSGVQAKLKAGVTLNGEAFAQMPIYSDASRVYPDKTDPDSIIVEMEGITQCIVPAVQIEGLSAQEVKDKTIKTIKDKELDQYPAAGVMYCEKEGGNWKIYPVVYVRDINTLFLETACGSGTTALGLVLALQEGKSIKDIQVIQPTGLPIKISVEYNGNQFGYAQISGPVEIIKSGSIETSDETSYAVEKVEAKQLEGKVVDPDLIKLYQEVFSEPPYNERFSAEEVKQYFLDYLREGSVYIARTSDRVIGFEATVLLTSVPEVAELMQTWTNIDVTNCLYITELGVAKGFRRKGVGQKLVEQQITAVNNYDYVLRTSIDNFPALGLYGKLGFRRIPDLIQEVIQERVTGKTESDPRIFLERKRKNE